MCTVWIPLPKTENMKFSRQGKMAHAQSSRRSARSLQRKLTVPSEPQHHLGGGETPLIKKKGLFMAQDLPKIKRIPHMQFDSLQKCGGTQRRVK